jgi:hypothetical protein
VQRRTDLQQIRVDSLPRLFSTIGRKEP